MVRFRGAFDWTGAPNADANANAIDQLTSLVNLRNELMHHPEMTLSKDEFDGKMGLLLSVLRNVVGLRGDTCPKVFVEFLSARHRTFRSLT